jgi:hypothetical protein
MLEVINNEAVKFFIESQGLTPSSESALKFIGNLPETYGKTTRMWFSGGVAAFVSRIKVSVAGSLVDGIEFHDVDLIPE